MTIDTNELLALPFEEKLKIIELLQNDLEHSEEITALPEWVREEAKKRLLEMKDPRNVRAHEEIWSRIDKKYG